MGRACEGRAAIVTGASRGIGAAIARRLAEDAVIERNRAFLAGGGALVSLSPGSPYALRVA